MNDTDATLVAAYARSWTRPDRARLPALVAEDTTLDYAALHERVARAAGARARRAGSGRLRRRGDGAFAGATDRDPGRDGGGRLPVSAGTAPGR